MAAGFEQAKRAYLKEIRRRIAFTGPAAKRYLRDLSDRLDEFADETGAEDISAVRAEFGTPEAVAQAFLEQTEPQRLKKNLRLPRVLLLALAAALLFALAVYFGARYHARQNPGYDTEAVFDTPEGYLESLGATGETV